MKTISEVVRVILLLVSAVQLSLVEMAALGLKRVVLTADNRIVNGKDARVADFPYQLSLRRNSVHLCGASVLSNDWAITAAHCVHGLEGKPNVFSLRGGSSMRLNGGITIQVKSILIHPSYNSSSWNYDVALLQTQKNRLRGKFVSRIRLAADNAAISVGTAAIISGWGHMNSGDKEFSKILKHAKVYIDDQNNCKESLKEFGNVTDVMFCASARNVDACQGDSGGPIQIDGILIGVVSWGVGCAEPDFPAVYTRLSYPGIRRWVKVVTRL